MAKTPKVSLSRVRELLSYDPVSGDLEWRAFHSARAPAGAKVRRKTHNGYLRVSVDNECIQAHRLIWFHVTGEWPKGDIDHINGDRSDNRMANMREATRAQNNQNMGIGKRNRSGFLGVGRLANSDKWRAQICVAGKNRNVGHFDTPEEASQAYIAAKAKLHPFNPIPREARR